MAAFAAFFVALYVGAQIGDFWVQSSDQAAGKGKPGREGRKHCAEHCLTYVATQMFCVALVMLVTGQGWGNAWLGMLAFLVSGVAHYAMDRRDQGILPWLTRVTRKQDFAKLGTPREPRVIEAWFDCSACKGDGVAPDGPCWDCRGGGKLPFALTIDDAPHLGTGAFALDQSWHVLTSMFIPALLMSVTL